MAAVRPDPDWSVWDGVQSWHYITDAVPGLVLVWLCLWLLQVWTWMTQAVRLCDVMFFVRRLLHWSPSPQRLPFAWNSCPP